MSGLALAAFGVAAAVLAGTIALELRGAASDRGRVAALPPPPAAAASPDRPAPAPDRTQAWVATILARPLFSPTRRPPPAAAAAAAPGIAELPRLTAVLVTPSGKSVIFAAANGGKPIVAAEGSRIGPYVVQRIEAGRITMLGPEGSRVLQPTFDKDAPRPPVPGSAAGAPPPGAFPGLPGLEKLLKRPEGAAALLPGLPASNAPPAPPSEAAR